LNFPYDESEHWRREFSQNSGYQKQLFEQSYEDFIHTVARENEDKLLKFLKMDEDRTNEIVESSVNYLKLRKVKRMLLENQLDLEKEHTPDEYNMLHQTHDHLKQMEMELTRKMGTVVIK
jgi:DNA primase